MNVRLIVRHARDAGGPKDAACARVRTCWRVPPRAQDEVEERARLEALRLNAHSVTVRG